MSVEMEREAYGVFLNALERDAHGRGRFLETACLANDELRNEVSKLLEVSDVDDDFLRAPDLLNAMDAGGLPLSLESGLFSEYEFVRELGRGSMGVVYLAIQKSLDREVAVKFLHPGLSLSPAYVERFRNEARSAAGLRHPGIVKVHDFGEHHGMYYIVMDYIAGASLRERVEVCREEGGALPRPAATAELVLRVAEALQHLHENGVVHRDVKPENILVDASGRPHLADFDLCRGLDLAHTRHALGTPLYMSPEQTISGRRVDQRSDVYSLGAVLYELLTSQPPLRGVDGRVVQAIREEEPVRPRKLRPDVPRDLEVICLTALAKDPERRYPSAAAFALDLRRFLNHESINARPPSVSERAGHFLRRHRRDMALGGIAALLLASGAFFAIDASADRHRQRALAPLRDLAREDLANAALDELVHGLHATRELRAGGALESEDEQLLDGLEARIAAVGRERLRRGTSAVLASQSELPWGQYASLATGVRYLMQASLLLPENERLAPQMEAAFWHPKLTVSSRPDGASVSMLPLDPDGRPAGEPVGVGTTPVARFTVAPGYYRVQVEVEGRGFGEVTRVFDRLQEEYVLDVPIVDTATATRDMVFIPAGPALVGSGEPGRSPFPRRSLDLEAFWIDRTEVTNGEYRRFVEATGHRAPMIWGERYDAAWDPLPVVAISYHDAEAYAVWSGRRLPTVAEWERAARGAEGREYPWGDSDALLERANLGKSAAQVGLSEPDRWTVDREGYLGGVLAVDASADLANPDGLLHVFGNVQEWTETFFVNEVAPGWWAPQTGYRVVKGGGWQSPALLSLATNTSVGVEMTDRSLGFRCAKSAP